ncbi:NAD(P)-dependent oxidoreductase [Portibacter marinus]|uniref:NAD(P)-dependent oxidoreductase n=1 Tax=Portibacter marinus TaxID=2898660 RepID=UPI001F2D2B2C|nr:D-isomer specific 2-hydroxyacid dehydrogenase family protein [Portibacter marinus]
MDGKYTLSTGPVLMSDLKSLLETVDVFWFRLAYKIDEKVLTNHTRCRVLATPVTGIDHIDENLCRKYNIEIVCLRGETEFLKEVRATAEHTIFLTLALLRKGLSSISSVLAGHWKRDDFRGYEVYGKKVGIIGMGRLGQIVAAYFKAMGCHILYFDTAERQNLEGFHEVNSMERLIELSDIVSLHIPYNEKNHKVLDSSILKRFTGSKWLINTSRGGVIDEEALVNVLKHSHLGGYATDVLYGEPDIAKNPLFIYAKDHENIIITPHIGGNTYESFNKTERFIADKIYRWVGKNYNV